MTPTPYIKKRTEEVIKNTETAKQLLKSVINKVLETRVINQTRLAYAIWIKTSNMSFLLDKTWKVGLLYFYTIKKETSIKFILKLEEFAKEKQLDWVLKYINDIKIDNSALFAS